jgi:hypothetical protein
VDFLRNHINPVKFLKTVTYAIKNPGPEYPTPLRLRRGKPGFDYPRLPARRAYSSERGDSVYWLSKLYGLLEYWSDGVMEKPTFSKFLESKAYRDFESSKFSFFQDHHSNTPSLHYSG